MKKSHFSKICIMSLMIFLSSMKLAAKYDQYSNENALQGGNISTRTTAQEKKIGFIQKKCRQTKKASMFSCKIGKFRYECPEEDLYEAFLMFSPLPLDTVYAYFRIACLAEGGVPFV